MENIPKTLALLEPDDLWPAWRMIDLEERDGETDEAEARRWKEGIFELMLRCGWSRLTFAARPARTRQPQP